MNWTESISESISYIEKNITDNISVGDIAAHVNISPFYFQKGFTMLCGFTPSEYIRNRRLAIAGSKLVMSDFSVIEISLKYGYDSPDSFAKAFTRFHGITPKMAKKEGAILKSFAPLMISLSLKGGFIMDYKIEKKDAFTVVGVAKRFSYESAKSEIPTFWDEHFASGNGKYICGVYGICIESESQKESEGFEYLIADPVGLVEDIPSEFKTRTIPSLTWAIFSCKGPMPNSLQDVNTKIYSEWLPAEKEYELAAGYSIELYDDARKYKNGTQDENYYSEIWVPVKRK